MNTAKLKAVALDATPGPWVETRGEVTTADYEVEGGVYLDHICNCEIIGTESPNAEFIALANPAAVLELIAALEAAQKRGTDMEVACELFAESKLAQIKLEAALGIAQQRLAELEARKLEVIIPPRRCHDYAAVAVQQRDEQWYKALHDACDRAGINLETGGEA